MQMIGILFFVLFVMAVPALILFLIERSRRHALQDRVDALEHRVDDMSRSLAALHRRDRAPAPAPSADEVTRPMAVPPDLEATRPMAPAPPAPLPLTPATLPPPSPPTPAPVPTATPVFARPVAPRPAPKLPSAGFEQRLATQWTTWLGAVALLLAGIFLVKLSIEWGILGPKARVAGAYLGGVALLAVGERLRARSYAAAQGASAAGVAVLYAATMAAANLYHFIGPFAAMALLLLTTGAAVLLAWRSGPAVAVVGLLGGFLLPVFLSSDRPRVWALLGYLLLVHGGLVAVAALRKWPALVAVSALGTLLWGGIYAWKYFGLAPWALGGLVLGAVAALLVARRTVKGGADYDLIPAGSLAAFFLILCTVARPYSTEAWAMLAILSAGMLLLSTRRPYEVAAFAAAVILLGTESVQLLGPHRPDSALAILLGFGALWTLGGWLAHWRSEQPVTNLLAGALAAVGTMGLAYLLDRQAPQAVRPSILALGGGVLLVLLAAPILRKRALPAANERLAVLLGGATLLLSAALPMELEDSWLTVAWAVEALLLVFLDSRLRVPALRVFAYGLAAGTGVRLLLNPWIFSYPTGTVPLFNWLLYAYGITTAAFVLAGRLLRAEGHGVPARAIEWLARATGTALVLLEIRHWLHHGTLKGKLDDPWEWAAYILAFFALAFLFKALHARALTPDNLTAACLLGMGALIFEVWILVLILNPLWHAVWVGTTPVANGLLVLYGLPLLGCLACARWIDGEVQPLRWFHLIGAYALGALLLTLLVRHAYHPETMHAGHASDLEQYTYSAAWILLAVGTLVGGIWRKSKVLRFTSLGVMMLAVAKVFLYDITALSDLHRFLSFVALGASLIGIGVIYQKFVFRDREAA